MNDKFLNQITEFIFVEDKPEKSDVIFIPGSGFPQTGNSQEYRKRKNFMTENMRQNGNF